MQINGKLHSKYFCVSVSAYISFIFPSYLHLSFDLLSNLSNVQ